MKTSLSHRPLRPALSRIAARAHHSATFQALALSPTPFADLMLHPEKVEAVLKTLASWKQKAMATPRSAARLLRTKIIPGKRGRTCRRAAPPGTGNPLAGLKNTEFHLAAPLARSVQLAADFTDWEKTPLDLIKAEDGVWFTVVPLLPGSYAYRFLVDGQVWKDPPSAQRTAGPPDMITRVVNVT